MMPEGDADKAFLLELADLPVALRAETEALRTAGQTGRVMMQSLAQELDVPNNETKLDDEVKAFLQGMADAWKVTPDAILRGAFTVRLFAW
jgi:hypothetical protein